MKSISHSVSAYELLQQKLQATPHTWLITGVAGFIGSNLLETLLNLNQRVVGLDNFSTGHQRNLNEVQSAVSAEQWNNFYFINGDIRDPQTCHEAMTHYDGEKASNVEYVLHQAALGSVPRSLQDPLATNSTNISGFLNVLVAARIAGVKSYVYAASSSTYGDHPALPKVEHQIGKPLSPYAVTKYVNEIYAEVFARCYGFTTVGLRYFNVFGKRQDPDGAYAAVIPKWVQSMLRGEQVIINGDGETSRDFCFIENTIQANLLAAVATDEAARNEIYNVAVSGRTTLNELFESLRRNLNASGFDYTKLPAYRDFRQGDVRHSQADISKAQQLLGYEPKFDLNAGLEQAVKWYIKRLLNQNAQTDA